MIGLQLFDPPFGFVDDYVVHDFRSDIELMAEWGQINRSEFRWQPRWGEWHRVVTAKHPTLAEAAQEARVMALAARYTPPRWWQFWRWSEQPLPGVNPRSPHDMNKAETGGGTK